jgi:pimeloyl-ACP methyl ester carboxylesterase
MIDDIDGCIEYEESGTGPCIVLVPGSCSTGAAWRSVASAWNGKFRCVTTSLLGYGETAERRTAQDHDMRLEAEVLEAVVRKAGGSVHLVGHSFGGLVSLAVALRKQTPLASLTILEAPAFTILRQHGRHAEYQAFRQMTEGYFAAYDRGENEAIAAMIDFYGGAGTFASWPSRIRDYAVRTTPINMLDWATADTLALPLKDLASINMPIMVIAGQASHLAMRCANQLLSVALTGAKYIEIEGAAHFMIANHPGYVADAIEQHVQAAREQSP